MGLENISQMGQTLEEQYPFTKYSIPVVILLVAIIFFATAGKSIAEEFGKDAYSFLRDRYKGFRKTPSHKSSSETFRSVALTFAVPQRNLNFTGREDILALLRGALTSGEIGMWKQVLTGLGGKGKSQIAAEYAYRHQEDYKLICWLRSEEPVALAANYASLASELDLPEKGSADQTAIIAAVKRRLGDNSGWLLIFDNAGNLEEIEQYLPREDTGHAIITSRNPNWGGACGVIPIEVFERKESIEFLLKRTTQTDEETAGKLADALGNLPLALEQAGAYIEESVISLADYLKLFQEQRNDILKRGNPVDYPDTIATTWDISFKAVQAKSADAIDLLKLLAFMAPDEILRSILIEGTSELPEPLSSTIKDGIRLNESMAALRRYSLISITDDLLSVHRLVQAVMLDRLAEDEKKKWAEAAIRMVNKAFPFDSDDVATWPICSSLLPHALTTAKFAEELDVARDTTGRLLNQIGLYLKGRAEFIKAKKNFERALEIGEKAYGKDHTQVAIYANNLGSVLKDLGDLQGAKKNYERALEIDEKAYGKDHTQVAIDFNNLGSVLKDLGDLQGAKKNFERALRIFQDRLGEDHPSTRTVGSNLELLKSGKL